MSGEPKIDSVHVEAGPAASIEEVRSQAIELLDNNEIVEFTIKPSPWMVVLVSARFVVIAVLGIVALLWSQAGGVFPYTPHIVALALLATLARVLLASLQWASRVYILTNRRVMRVTGIVRVETTECPLKQVRKTEIVHENLVRFRTLATLRLWQRDPDAPPVSWEYISPYEAIHERLLRAIRRSRDS